MSSWFIYSMIILSIWSQTIVLGSDQNSQILSCLDSTSAFLFFFFLCLFLRETERERETRRETASKIGSRFQAVSTEPNVGFKLMNCAIMTWAEVLTNWATQAPLLLCSNFMKLYFFYFTVIKKRYLTDFWVLKSDKETLETCILNALWIDILIEV